MKVQTERVDVVECSLAELDKGRLADLQVNQRLALLKRRGAELPETTKSVEADGKQRRASDLTCVTAYRTENLTDR